MVLADPSIAIVPPVVLVADQADRSIMTVPTIMMGLEGLEDQVVQVVQVVPAGVALAVPHQSH